MQVVGELLFDVGLKTVAEPFRNPERRHPVMAGTGSLLTGGLAGLISYWILPHRVFGVAGVPGMSLIAAPIANAVAMEALGRWRDSQNARRTYITTWWAGGLFAFGMALVRFLLIRAPGA